MIINTDIFTRLLPPMFGTLSYIVIKHVSKSKFSSTKYKCTIEE